MKCAACGYMDKESVEKEYPVEQRFNKYTGLYSIIRVKYCTAINSYEKYGEFTKAKVQTYEAYGKPITSINIVACPKCGTVKMEV